MSKFIALFICLVLFSATPVHGSDHPHEFIVSPCGTPLTINFTGIFDAYEIACTQFRATSLLEVVQVSLNFDDIEHTSSPSDLDIAITSQISHQNLHIGGWDDDARIGEDIEWPNTWQFSAEAGLYTAAINVEKYFLDDDGVYDICIMNKWINSGDAIYNGLIELQGMTSDCDVTSAPSATPEMVASQAAQCEGETGVDITYDLSFTGREKKCIDPFVAQGDLLAFNFDVEFTPKQMFLGIQPVDQTMWAADLECTLTQLSSNKSVTIGYDPLDNQFSGDDDGEDNDEGSFFYGFSLNTTNEVIDIMDASLWLSPSSSLTEVMVPGVESCDGEFCSKFTGTTTFESRGSANHNNYYPRYVNNMTGVFTIRSQVLRNFVCDDHFIMLSRKPLGGTFAYGIREDTITFAWDCKHKFIFTESEQTLRGEFCGKTGFYDVEVGIDADGNAFFRDDICGEMKLPLSEEDAAGSWYLFIGSDNDNINPEANDDTNENELVSSGLNRYRLEWPVTWASDVTGNYLASILPKFHEFDQIGRYQLCFANTWNSFSNADVEGTVRLVGLQSCENLVCSPGDRDYCSNRGICVNDGSGCNCDDNSTSSDTCVKALSSPDYLFDYEHSILVLGCVGGAIFLAALGVVIYVIINNREHEAHSKDVVVEQVDLENIETLMDAQAAKDILKPKAAKSAKDKYATIEIPPHPGTKTSEDSGNDLDKSRFQAYQVYKQSPLSPLKAHDLSAQSGRKSPKRDDLKKNASLNDVAPASSPPRKKLGHQESMPIPMSEKEVSKEDVSREKDKIEEDDEADETTSMISHDSKEMKQEETPPVVVPVVTETALTQGEKLEEEEVLLGGESDEEEQEKKDEDLPPPPTIDLPPPPTIDLPPPPTTP
mmetsp:Transcript_242/g.507  ORF Transcript_242/g.507 Transcript_242/m.507 type:complete len:883 (-) Transcript_242:353-3001(-)|eukprot:CAMPEP_0114428984 /NCGR_PEP_ID=MMETSP0103-20121206/9232_1 /TAXON_ID=37642 ORGANISM="Paraphysomonas imperforata, Strain PA2" /NCGR_SAMPLE_ID=MMETSP0103 /ASSEMBLY_ACC=CAM_ASM_000201 /LENGTH=882 /DNA_ID=CAMNT_0001598267 /DNA_START=121 /DNA_END=2769 /DNA_ORIENTATION=-